MTPQRTPATATAPATNSRSANACENCRRRKVKCSGERPCRSCIRHHTQCFFPTPGRSRYSEDYIQGLLSTIKTYEERLKVAGLSSSGVSPSNVSREAAPNPTTPAASGTTPVATAVSHVDTVSPASSAPTERASGPAFEMRVRHLLQHNNHTSSGQDSHSQSPDDTTDHHHHHHQQEQEQRQRQRQDQNLQGLNQPNTPSNPNPQWRSMTDMLDGVPTPVIPPEPDSHRLLTLFLSYLGVNQHFIDPRSFIDTMTLLYQGPESRQRLTGSIWFVEYLLVMAMGKLMDFDTQASETYHGLTYFAEAMRLMPPLYGMNSHGVVAVEILTLVALYLQWRDRKQDAYLYIGTAVRMAVALGCALPYDEQQCLPSEKAHRVRVWWTTFMLDRRLSADLGLPVAADDRQLSAELPQASPGFPSPQAIIINVKIARATGDIMTSLYGNANVTQLELVRSIQDILSSLYETGHSIPPEFTIDLTRPFPAVTRTGGSLYLMLFQAIILCTRPILLQRVKDKVTSSLTGTTLSRPSEAVDRLCYTCKESAIKSIRILYGLRKRSEIARFGFFDLDATFSAALTLVMIGFIDDVASSNMPPELRQASEVLQYLSQAGNRAAEQRMRDIHQFCGHVWSTPPILGQTSKVAETSDTTRTANPRDGATSEPGPPRAENPPAEDDAGSLPPPYDADQDADMSLEHGQMAMNSLVDFDRGCDFGQDLHLDADGIYSSFNDPNLPLTGVDQLDWAEMEKIFTARAG